LGLGAAELTHSPATRILSLLVPSLPLVDLKLEVMWEMVQEELVKEVMWEMAKEVMSEMAKVAMWEMAKVVMWEMAKEVMWGMVLPPVMGLVYVESGECSRMLIERFLSMRS
jgi:hypothetical protein